MFGHFWEYIRLSLRIYTVGLVATRNGGDGWESNPPRTRHRRPADGFEDRGRHQPPNIPSSRPKSDRLASASILRPRRHCARDVGGRIMAPMPFLDPLTGEVSIWAADLKAGALPWVCARSGRRADDTIRVQ